MSDGDALARFLSSYDEGSTLFPLREILGGPSPRFDDVTSAHPAARRLLDYVDAIAYGTRLAAYTTSRYLTLKYGQFGPAFQFDGRLLELLMEVRRGNDAVFELLRTRAPANKILAVTLQWLVLEKERGELAEKDVLAAVEGIPAMHARLLEQQLRMTTVRNRLLRERAKLFEVLSNPDRPHCAHQRVVSSEMTVAASQALASAGDRVPLVFIDPAEWESGELFAALAGKPAVLTFSSVSRLFAAALSPQVMAALLDPAHLILVAESYPVAQLATQTVGDPFRQPLAPVLLTESPAVVARANVMAESLGQVLAAYSPSMTDTPAANWFYRLGRDAAKIETGERLGVDRWPALGVQYGQVAWYDPHKGQPPAGIDLGPAVPDYTTKALERVVPTAPRRRLSAKAPYRLAHVTGQIVDGSHAPSRLLRTLLKNHDRSRYELSVFVTDGMVPRIDEYPAFPYISAPTRERAPSTLSMLASQGIGVHVDEEGGTLSDVARRIAARLTAAAVDIAVFHGPDFVHTAIARMGDVPLRVMFEHGTLPSSPGYDLAVASADSAEAVEAMKERFLAMGTVLVRNPHVVDARESWDAQPHPKSALGFPDDALLMTTISNHLDNRLSPAMCSAIAAILKRCPRAYYAPMGPVRDTQRLGRIFAELGVADRVRFLGSRPCPSQVARSMEIYLNEFPFGGGIALLDALSAGLPLVSMHDESGPPQAKYAGAYFGMDRVVRSCRPEEYVDLACRLLEKPEMLAEWRAAALAKYEAHTDTKRYVRRFEEIVEEWIAARGR